MELRLIPVWDVAAVLTYAILRTYTGIEHAWEIVVLLGFACCLDRDMEIHEAIQALYMLRFSCHTIEIDSAPAYTLCLLVTIMSLCSQTERYQMQGHMVRRAFVGAATFFAVLVKYEWNSSPLLSVVRLLFYVCTTRISVSDAGMDSWDAALQSLWLFVVPIYFYLFVIAQFITRNWSLLNRLPLRADSCIV